MTGLRPARSRTLALRAAGGLLLLAAIHAAALRLTAPLLLLLLLWAVLFGLVAVRSRRAALRLLALNLAVICTVLALAEAFFFLGSRRDDPADFSQTSSHDYKIPHDVLGWAPYPSNSREVGKSYRGEVLYRTTYTIDDLALRISPPEDPAGVAGTVLFFGGSFTFGEGVADEETLPYRTGVLTEGQWRVRNLGFHGYGPQQMLASLESDLVSPLVAPGGRVVAVYQCALFHARRAAGRVSWRRFMPRYRLGPNGALHRAGFFPDPAQDRETASFFLDRSALFKHLFGADRAGTIGEIDLMVALAAASRDEFRRNHPDAEFHVLYWDEASRWHDSRVLAGLQAENIPTHRVSAVFDPADLAYRISPHDRHPNAAAHSALAEFVATSILAADR